MQFFDPPYPLQCTPFGPDGKQQEYQWQEQEEDDHDNVMHDA